MTWQQWVVSATLLVLVILLVRGRRSSAALFVSVAFFFIVLDFITMKTAIQQIANPGLVTLAVLLLLSVALDKSHLLEPMVDMLARGPYRWSLAKLVTATAAYSAVLNNTAVVASLIGPLRATSYHPASRLLLPMCYAATLGGTLTLVGTSTNLLVNSFLIARGLPTLKLFDLLPVGGLLVLGCGSVMLLLFPRLMPIRPAHSGEAKDYFVEATVRPESTLIGQTVEANGLRNLGHLFLTEIVRPDRIVAPVAPDELLQRGDVLVFSGDVTRLDLLTRFGGLQTSGHHDDLPFDNLVEVVVALHSPLARRTVKEVDFRSQFDAAVVAVRRGSARLGGSIGSIRLEVGDTLVLVIGKDFEKRNNLSRNFVIVSRRNLQKFSDPRKAWLSLAGFVGVILLAALGLLDFLKGLLVLLALFIAFDFIRWQDLRRNMPFEIVATIGSALIIGEVMISTGVASQLASVLLRSAAQFGPAMALGSLLLVTWLLTEAMSNNAAAALTFPVGLGMAEQLGLSPMPFVMAVLYGASCCFISPFGYQTNLMVMSPGRYVTSDYVRAGLPIVLVYLGICLVALPVVFPFSIA